MGGWPDLHRLTEVNRRCTNAVRGKKGTYVRLIANQGFGAFEVSWSCNGFFEHKPLSNKIKVTLLVPKGSLAWCKRQLGRWKFDGCRMSAGPKMSGTLGGDVASPVRVVGEGTSKCPATAKPRILTLDFGFSPVVIFQHNF